MASNYLVGITQPGVIHHYVGNSFLDGILAFDLLILTVIPVTRTRRIRVHFSGTSEETTQLDLHRRLG